MTTQPMSHDAQGKRITGFWQRAGRKAGRLIHWLGLDATHFAVLVMLTMVAVPVWLALFSPAPMAYSHMPVPVTNSPVPAGGSVILHLERCNTSGQTLTYPITRQLRNVNTDEVLLLTSASTTAEPGCTTVDSRIHAIPVDVPPGRYVLYGVATVSGRFRNFQIPYGTEPFEVVRP